MPDWSYHNLLKPLLFRLPAESARQLTLGAVSMLGSTSPGRRLIDLMGHMQPASDLEVERAGLRFPCRAGLAAGISQGRGEIRAFERFGFGFLEVGPVTVMRPPGEKLALDPSKRSISSADLPDGCALEEFLKSHVAREKPALPLLVRVAHLPDTDLSGGCSELMQLASALPSWTTALVVDSRWGLSQWSQDERRRYFACLKDTGRRFIVALPPDCPQALVAELVLLGLDFGATGFSVTGGVIDPGSGRRTFGEPTREASLAMVSRVRSLAPDSLVIGSGGVIEPGDAVRMLESGADLVGLRSGLIFSGPGLSKRINELWWLIICRRRSPTEPPDGAFPYSVTAVLQSGWLGLALVGFGLIVTGASAITVALTTVVLPYDESFLGLSRSALLEINPRLLSFMSHDRVTYAGAGMSCGLLFSFLAYFGGRAGQRWAYRASCASCAFGFASFLLFLAFRYLDPLHALVTLLLLPFFIWALAKPPQWTAARSSNYSNSAAWRRSLWGQLLFVGIGAGLVLAGATICVVGSTTVFVPEDLMFMQTTASKLLCHSERLLPTIAHDRAGFGGTLVTAGIAVSLTALQGFRQGEGWVWWMLLIAGLPGFLCALGIHFAIGYTNFVHLLPAYIATAMFAGGLALSYRYLCLEPGPDLFELSWIFPRDSRSGAQ